VGIDLSVRITAHRDVREASLYFFYQTRKSHVRVDHGVCLRVNGNETKEKPMNENIFDAQIDALIMETEETETPQEEES